MANTPKLVVHRIFGSFAVGAVIACAVLAIFVFAAASPSSASAFPQGPWQPAFNLSQGPGSSAQVVIARDGTTTIVWSSNTGVMSATRAPNDGFGSISEISPPPITGAPRAAVSPDGTVTVAWMNIDGSVFASTRPPEGVFGPVETLSPPDADDQESYYGNPLRIESSLGSTVVTWMKRNGNLQYLEAAVRPRGGQFTDPVTLSPTAEVKNRSAYEPDLAVTPVGSATVVWNQHEPGGNYSLAATSTPDGAFGEPVIISRGGTDPQIVVSQNGSTLVALSKVVDSKPKIQIVTRPPGGKFSLPRNYGPKVSGSFGGSNGYRIADAGIGPDGKVTVAANLKFNDDLYAHVMTQSRRGRFGSPAELPGSLGYYIAQLSVGPDGTANLIAMNYDGEGPVAIWTRLHGGSFGNPVTLQEYSSGGPSIATGPEGLAAAAWNVGGLGKYDFSQIETASTIPDASYCERATLRSGRLKVKRKSGVGWLTVITGTQGSLSVASNSQVRANRTITKLPGSSKVKIKAWGLAATKLKKRGTMTVKAKVRFEPGFGCEGRSISRNLKLVRKVR